MTEAGCPLGGRPNGWKRELETMKLYLTMPKPGETIREGVVVQWLKKAGENVEEKDPLVELETEKAVFTYESPFKGKIEKILIEENASIAVGSPIALFEVSEEDGQRYLMLGVGLPVEESKVAAPVQKNVGANPHVRPPVERQTHRSAPTVKRPAVYSPLIRNLARENHLSDADLANISGSGPGGRLTKEDILNYLKSPRISPLSKGSGGDFEQAPTYLLQEGDEKISLSVIRQRIAQVMKKSADQIPKAGSGTDVDASEIWEYCKTHQTEFQNKHQVALKPFHFFLYAVREALKKYPNFNASYVEENGKSFLIKHKPIHLGFAVATLQGLFTPVVKNAQDKKFSDLSKVLADLEKKAKEGKLSVDELTGATFVVNNPGAVGGTRCDQIIPLPTVAIIALNRIQKRPWAVGDEIKIRHVVGVDLAFDHRPLDGADGIQFVEEVRKILEKFPFEIVDK